MYLQSVWGKLGILNIENIKFVDEYQSQSR